MPRPTRTRRSTSGTSAPGIAKRDQMHGHWSLLHEDDLPRFEQGLQLERMRGLRSVSCQPRLHPGIGEPPCLQDVTPRATRSPGPPAGRSDGGIVKGNAVAPDSGAPPMPKKTVASTRGRPGLEVVQRAPT